MNAITILACIIAGGGFLCFLIWVKLIGEASKLRNLKRFRSKNAGVADLLNYATMVDDGIIACKSGALMAAWVYTGKDNAQKTEAELNQTSDLLNRALLPLDDGWMLHVDNVRHEAPRYPERNRSHFPDPVSAAVDEERRRLFETQGIMYEGHFVLTVTWLPPLLAERKAVELMFDDDRKPDSKPRQFSILLDSFKKNVRALEERLSTTLTLHRLQTQAYEREDGITEYYDDFLQHLERCVTGISHPVHLPSCPNYLDILLGGPEFWGGTIPKMGRKFIQVVSIEGFPPMSTPGILSSLAELDLEYRWSTRFIFLGKQTALAHISVYRRKWRQKLYGIADVVSGRMSRINQEAKDMADDADDAYTGVQKSDYATGYLSSVIVLMDEDRDKVENEAVKLQKGIFHLGFTARIETINCMDAFFGSLPGHGFENVRRPIVTTQSLADIIPSSSIWTGSSVAPCPLYPPNSPALCHCVTTGSSPFRLNLHVRDVGHTVMFGPTGAGKSTALALIAMQMRRYPNASIFVFDKGMSMYATTKACNGQHFDIAGESAKYQFAPLQHLETAQDRAWALDWLDTLLTLNNVQTGPGDRNELERMLIQAHENKIHKLDAFMGLLSPHLRNALLTYITGSNGTLFNAEEDKLELSSFSTFEMEHILGMGDRWALPILLYLFRRIEKALRGQPALLILDEAWLMLGHPIFKEKIREWFKVLRKSNCALFMATQSISDAVNSSIWDVVLSETATKIFLPNPSARDIADIYRQMGLNLHQVEMIATAIPKRQYYLTSEKGCRLFSFALGPLALAFVGASDRESVQAIQNLEHQYGDEWVSIWLQSKGLSLDAFKGEAA